MLRLRSPDALKASAVGGVDGAIDAPERLPTAAGTHAQRPTPAQPMSAAPKANPGMAAWLSSPQCLWTLRGGGYALLLTALLAAVVLLARRDETDAWIIHAANVRHATTELLNAVQDAESATRAFLLTRSPTRLEPYEQATRDLPALQARLNALTRDEPSQRARVEAVIPLLAARFDRLANAIDLARQGDEVALASRIQNEDGQPIIAAVRAGLAAIYDSETRTMEDRRLRAQHQQVLLLSVISGALGLTFVLGLTSMLLTRREAGALRAANTHLDRTLQAQTEALRATAERLTFVTDTAHIGLAVIDQERRFRYVNRLYAESIGLSPDAMVGRRVDEQLRGNDAEQLRPHLERALRGERVSYQHIASPSAPGEPSRHVVITMEPALDEAGARVAVGVAVDITEHSITLAALRRSEARFHSVFDDSPLGMLIISQADGRIVAANAAICRMLGYSESELVGRAAIELVRPEDRLSRNTGATAHEIAAVTERRYATKSGGTMTGRAQIARLGATSGPGQLLLCTIEDVTQQREMESELRQAQRLDAIGRLTGGVAHDFNNLLGVIMGNVEFLIDELGNMPWAHELATQILDSAINGAALARRLLAYARKQSLQPAVIDLNESIPTHVSLLQRALGESIKVSVVLGPGLWPTLADPAQIGDVLINLALNARDAMPSGGRLSIETENAVLDASYAALYPEVMPGEYVMLAVADTGQGMPSDVLARATDPFFTTKPLGQGSGLGLSTIFGFAKQSGGHLSIYSEPGIGTTVRLYLPRAQNAEVAQARGEPTDALPRGSETILLVDDNDVMRATAARNLTALGYQVRLAGSAPAALTMLRDGTPCDMLLTDVVMPGGKSGYELAAEAQALRPKLRVLFTTGFAGAGGENTEGPSAEVLLKPYRRPELAERVRAVLDGAA